MYYKGFTLIEMLVVIGIVGILLAAAVASYARMDDRAKVEEAANTILAELRSLQKDANSGDSKGVCDDNEVFSGIQLFPGVAGQPYEARYICNASPTPAGSPKYIPEKQLKSSLTVSYTGLLPTFLTVNKGILNPTTITISSGSNSYSVIMTASGGMSVRKN